VEANQQKFLLTQIITLWQFESSKRLKPLFDSQPEDRLFLDSSSLLIRSATRYFLECDFGLESYSANTGIDRQINSAFFFNSAA
jgi:hypothetical protein